MYVDFDIKFDSILSNIVSWYLRIIMIHDVCSFRVVFYDYKCIITLMRDAFFENVFNGLMMKLIYLILLVLL